MVLTKHKRAVHKDRVGIVVIHFNGAYTIQFGSSVKIPTHYSVVSIGQEQVYYHRSDPGSWLVSAPTEEPGSVAVDPAFKLVVELQSADELIELAEIADNVISVKLYPKCDMRGLESVKKKALEMILSSLRDHSKSRLGVYTVAELSNTVQPTRQSDFGRIKREWSLGKYDPELIHDSRFTAYSRLYSVDL